MCSKRLNVFVCSLLEPGYEVGEIVLIPMLVGWNAELPKRHLRDTEIHLIELLREQFQQFDTCRGVHSKALWTGIRFGTGSPGTWKTFHFDESRATVRVQSRRDRTRAGIIGLPRGRSGAKSWNPSPPHRAAPTALSVRRLAELEPATVGAGYGVPLAGAEATEGVQRLAGRFPVWAALLLNHFA